MKVIILAGGKGTRLWPMSREKYSKQFLKLVDDTPLIEASYQRALKIVGAEDIVTITNKDYYFYTKEICDKFSPSLSQNIITLIKNIVDFKGEIKYDFSKPDGTPRKLLDVSKIKELGWEAKISLDEGIRKTYSSYEDGDF